jgi:flagellin
MSISINTNTSALFAQRAMGSAQSTVRTSVDRLSSGLRINAARDDAAGLSISSRMTSHVRSSVPLMRGINDGVSVLQVAGGGLRGTLDSLQRMRELSIQAANDTLLPSDREALNIEFQQMMAQIDHISNTTEIFDIFPLKGLASFNSAIAKTSLASDSKTKHIMDVFPASGTSISISSGIKPIAYIPQGATDVTITIDSYGLDDDLQIFTKNGNHLVGTPLSDTTWIDNGVSNTTDIKDKVFTRSQSSFDSSAEYDSSNLLDGQSQFSNNLNSSSALTQNFNGMNFKYTGDGEYQDDNPNDRNNYVERIETIHIDETTEPLIIMVTGTGAFEATVSWGSMPTKVNTPVSAPATPKPTAQPGLNIMTSATPGQAPTFVTIEITPTDTQALGLVGSALNPLDEAIAAISKLDAAISQVADYAVKHGAVEARLEHAVANASVSSDSISAARSRILDTDFAIETAQLSASMIQSSASTAMGAQANLTPKLVLQLLNGNY